MLSPSREGDRRRRITMPVVFDVNGVLCRFSLSDLEMSDSKMELAVCYYVSHKPWQPPALQNNTTSEATNRGCFSVATHT